MPRTTTTTTMTKDVLAAKTALALCKDVSTGSASHRLVLRIRIRTRRARFCLQLGEGGMKGKSRAGGGQEKMGELAPEGIVQLGQDLCARGRREDVLAGSGHGLEGKAQMRERIGRTVSWVHRREKLGVEERNETRHGVLAWPWRA